MPLTALLVGCQAPAGPEPLAGKSLSIKQVGEGPLGGRVKVFAATSVAELQAMVWASGSTPSYTECASAEAPSTPGLRDACWWSAGFQTGSLLVATTLAQPNCGRPKAVTASLTGASTLQIAVDHGGTCVPNSGNQVGAQLSLLALPSADLPPLVLEVRVSHLGDPLAASATEVDLRRPLDESGEALALTRDVRQAYIRASEDAFSRYGTDFFPAGIAIRRWSDAGVGCPARGQKYEARSVHGYVVRMRMARDPRQVTVEYHGRPDALSFCGATTPAKLPSPSASP